MITEYRISMRNKNLGMMVSFESPLTENLVASLKFFGAIAELGQTGTLPDRSDYSGTPFERYADSATHEHDELREILQKSSLLEAEQIPQKGAVLLQMDFLEENRDDREILEKTWRMETFFEKEGRLRSFSLKKLRDGVLIHAD